MTEMWTRAEFSLDADLLTTLEVPEQVAVVGAGRWARILCRVLTTFEPRIRNIVLVAERNYQSAVAWADEQRGPAPNGHGNLVVVSSLREVRASDDIEAAFVTKMASEHYAATRDLLLAGKHVLVEKPFVLDPTEAMELVHLARARRRTLAVGYEFMFASALHDLRAAIGEHLPDVSSVRVVWEDVRNAVKWGVRKEPDVSANIVTDLYPHVLSQLLILFGRRDIALRRLTSRDGCSDASIELDYGSIAVTAALSKDAEKPQRRISVTSSSGRSLRLDFTHEPPRLELDGEALAAGGSDGFGG